MENDKWKMENVLPLLLLPTATASCSVLKKCPHSKSYN